MLNTFKMLPECRIFDKYSHAVGGQIGAFSAMLAHKPRGKRYWVCYLEG